MLSKLNLISLITILRKEIIRIFRIWTQTILPSAVTMFLYFLIFGNLIGSKLGKINNVEYIKYIVPGLMMMSITINSYSNVVSSFFGSKFQKNIEELLVSPTYNFILIVGFSFGGIIRGIFVGLLVYCVSLFFVDIKCFNYFLLFTVVFLTSFLFSLAGLLNGILAKKFDDISIIPTFVLTPLTYLGGVFYSVDFLPYFWKKIMYFNPVFYIVNFFRYSILGFSDVNIFVSFFVIVFFIFILYYVCLSLIKKGYNLRS